MLSLFRIWSCKEHRRQGNISVARARMGEVQADGDGKRWGDSGRVRNGRNVEVQTEGTGWQRHVGAKKQL
jgi:hypothetical protein